MPGIQEKTFPSTPVTTASSLTQRSSDALTTGKIKASLVDDKLLQAGAFKVVTERGTTYMMGLVTPQEAERATNLARTVGGVQRVVRVFEMISPEDLNRIATTGNGSRSYLIRPTFARRYIKPGKSVTARRDGGVSRMKLSP